MNYLIELVLGFGSSPKITTIFTSCPQKEQKFCFFGRDGLRNRLSKLNNHFLQGLIVESIHWDWLLKIGPFPVDWISCIRTLTAVH